MNINQLERKAPVVVIRSVSRYHSEEITAWALIELVTIGGGHDVRLITTFDTYGEALAEWHAIHAGEVRA